MLKKYTGLFLLLIAYAILLGHDVIPHHHGEINSHENADDHHHSTIPHHHHEHTTNSSHGHDHSSNDGDDKEASNLGHLFSQFFHAADGITFTSRTFISNTISKQLSSFDVILPTSFLIEEIDIPPLINKIENDFLLPNHFLIQHFGLRAPPAL